MDQKYIRERLLQWMETFVEQPNPKLGDWPPCPFARQARMGNKIEIRFSEAGLLAYDVYKSLCVLEEGREVIVICFDHTTAGPTFVQELVQALNRELMKQNYVILEDHPDLPEYVNNVCMNFGECGLLVVQKLDKLNSASDQLREKGYYHSWNQEAIDEVVSWRYNN